MKPEPVLISNTAPALIRCAGECGRMLNPLTEDVFPLLFGGCLCAACFEATHAVPSREELLGE